MTLGVDPADIERFRAVIVHRLGFHFEDHQLDYLSEVLRDRMNATSSPCFDAYIDRLSRRSHGSEEVRALAEAITVNETFFLRDAGHFRVLRHLLAERARDGAGEKKLRILSAGCASGEEPYSLAITIREALPDFEAWDIKILGVDVNPSMLEKARRALYSSWSLRAAPEELLRRYFRQSGKNFCLVSAVREMVTFEERNLVTPDPQLWQPETYDFVFCRNVIMYFTQATARRVVRSLNRALVPGGFLFLGHAETLRNLSQEFGLCQSHDTFYYQKDACTGAVIHPRLSTPVALSSQSFPTLAEPAMPWADEIQRASDRIAKLASHPVVSGVDRPSSPPSYNSRSRDLSLVRNALREERFAEALTLLSELPAEAQAEPEAELLKAISLTNSGAFEQAEASCGRVLALDQLNAGAHYVMALCKEQSGDFARAIECDRSAICLDQTFAMPHVHLGLMARRSGDDAEAKRALSQAHILLGSEDSFRLLLYSGGFSRRTLLALCRSELRAAGGDGCLR